MKKSNMPNQNAIADMQNSPDYVVLDNPFANPKFVKQLSKTEFTLAKTDIYSLKLFSEVISRLNSELLENATTDNQLKIELNIKNFLENIGVQHTRGYGFVIEAAEYLQSIKLQWKEKDGTHKSSVFISVSEHNPKTGKINIYIPFQFAKRVLDVGLKENFSYLKENLFKLNNNQAIKLYQFFKSWSNKGRYETDLERFREQFGFNTKGYVKFINLKIRVLEPAINEINDKTDIVVKYEVTGDALDSKKPRVKGLIFYITSKDKLKKLPNGERHATTTPQPEQQKQPEQAPQPKQANEPSEAMIIAIAQQSKFELEFIQNIIAATNNIRAWEIFKEFSTISKNQPIHTPNAYIIKSINSLGLGLWSKEIEKIKMQELKQQEIQKSNFLKMINEDYEKKTENHYLTKYEESTEEEKQAILEKIKIDYAGQFVLQYYIKNNELTQRGKIYAGEKIADELQQGIAYRQMKYRKFILDNYQVTIDFNEKDQIILP